MTNQENTGLIIIGLSALYLWYSYEPSKTGINPIFQGNTQVEPLTSDLTATLNIPIDTNEGLQINTNNLLTAEDKDALFSDNQDINIIDIETPPKPADFGLNL